MEPPSVLSRETEAIARKVKGRREKGGDATCKHKA